jgi:phage gp29-like protein
VSNRRPARWLSLFRRLGALVSDGDRPPASGADGPTIRPWFDDATRTYPTFGLSPSHVLALLQAADQGHPQQQFELFDEMLQKWPRLTAVEATRRLALTGLEWEVHPGSDGDDAARAVADDCTQTLLRLEDWPAVLDHLASAIGYGIAVAELVWADGQLVDLVPVPPSRLISDPQVPGQLAVRTAEAPSTGVPLAAEPWKWLVHRPRARMERPFEGGLLRASTLLYVAQNLSFKDWLIYSQVAGMPARIARFDPGTPEADKRALLRLLEQLGTDAVAAFSKNVDLQFIDPGSGPRPYGPLQDYCNTEVTILWLGQHLTTDIRQSGSRAAADVHDRVREDLLVHDIADEGRSVRRDLLTPLVRTRFGDRAAVPHFRRSLVQSVDTKTLAETLAVAVNDLGVAVPRRWLHQALGIPEPQADEPTIAGRATDMTALPTNNPAKQEPTE